MWPSKGALIAFPFRNFLVGQMVRKNSSREWVALEQRRGLGEIAQKYCFAVSNYLDISMKVERYRGLSLWEGVAK